MFNRLPHFFAPFIKPALATLLLLRFCLLASATTVLVILTPDGIVIAADTKAVSKDFGGHSAPDAGPTNKIFVIHDRIAVGTVGFGSQYITTMDDRPVFSYDPASFLKKIELETPRNLPVSKFVELLAKESHAKFSHLNQYPVLCNAKGFQYLVAGFESGIAVVMEVNFTIDAKSCQIKGPDMLRIFPSPQTNRFDFGFHVASQSCQQSADDIIEGKTTSPAYRSIAAEDGVELSMLLDRKDLSLNQASALLLAVLRAQNEYTPKFVGPPYSIVWLRKNGSVHRFNYDYPDPLTGSLDQVQKGSATWAPRLVDSRFPTCDAHPL